MIFLVSSSNTIVTQRFTALRPELISSLKKYLERDVVKLKAMIKANILTQKIKITTFAGHWFHKKETTVISSTGKHVAVKYYKLINYLGSGKLLK